MTVTAKFFSLEGINLNKVSNKNSHRGTNGTSWLVFDTDVLPGVNTIVLIKFGAGTRCNGEVTFLGLCVWFAWVLAGSACHERKTCCLCRKAGMPLLFKDVQARA